MDALQAVLKNPPINTKNQNVKVSRESSDGLVGQCVYATKQLNGIDVSSMYSCVRLSCISISAPPMPR